MRNKTQNANESLNALIWKRCPKTVFVSQYVVKLAASIGVQNFNEGAVLTLRLLHSLKLDFGAETLRQTDKKNNRRRSQSELAASLVAKRQLKTKVFKKKKQQDQWQKTDRRHPVCSWRVPIS